MANKTLKERALTLAKINGELAVISIAMANRNVGWENPNIPSAPTSDAMFINAWLRPDAYESYWNSTWGKASPEKIELRLADALGATLYGQVSSVCAELNLKPQLYAKLLTWSQNERIILEREIFPFLHNSCKVIINQAVQLRKTSIASLQYLSASLSKKSNLDLFTENLAMYISLRQLGPLLDVADLRTHINDKDISDDLCCDAAKWEKIKLQEACSSSSSPRLGWQHSSWVDHSVMDSPHKKVTTAILKHLGVNTPEAGRALLMARSPAIGLMSHLFLVWEIADILFKNDENRKIILQQKINIIIKLQEESIAVLEKDLSKLIKTNDWSLYSPIVKLVVAGYRYEGFPSFILDKFTSEVIPKPTATYADHMSLVLTIAGITLAFFPPAAFAGILVGLAGASVSVGAKIVELQNAREDNESREKVIAGKPASSEAVDLVEKPKSTQDIETALVVELLFGAFAVNDAKNLLKTIYAATAKKTIAETAETGLKKLSASGDVLEASANSANKKAISNSTKKVSTKESIASAGVHPQQGAVADTPYSTVLNQAIGQKGGAAQSTLNRGVIQGPTLKPVTTKETDDLLAYINGVESHQKAAALTKQTTGSAEAEIAKRQALQKQLVDTESRRDSLKMQKDLQNTAPTHSEAVRIKSRINTISERMTRKNIPEEEYERLKKLRNELNDQLNARESLQTLRAVTVTSRHNIAKEIEKSGADIINLKNTIKKEREKLSDLQLKINYLVGKAKQDAQIKITDIIKNIEKLSEKLSKDMKIAYETIKSLRDSDPGKAVLDELIKRGVLTITAGSDMFPEITLYGEFLEVK